MTFPITVWSRIREGDADYVVRRYWQPVFDCFRRKGVPPEDARELTQDALVVVAGKLKTLDSAAGQFRAFVCGVARKKWLMWRRGKRTIKNSPPGGLRSLDSDSILEVADPRTASFEALFDRLWGMALLLRAYERLAAKNPRYARVLQLSVQGDAHREIAEALEMGVDAVTNAVTRARAQLKREILTELRDYCSPERLEDELSALRGLGVELTPR